MTNRDKIFFRDTMQLTCLYLRPPRGRLNQAYSKKNLSKGAYEHCKASISYLPTGACPLRKSSARMVVPVCLHAGRGGDCFTQLQEKYQTK